MLTSDEIIGKKIELLEELQITHPDLKEPSSSPYREDPRKDWVAYYRLKAIYPNMEGKLGLEISPFGYTKNGVIPIVNHPYCWPEYWEKI